MRLYCQIRGDLRREKVPTNGELGLPEQFEEEEGCGLPGMNQHLPMHKRSDSEQIVAMLEQLKAKDPNVRYAYEYSDDSGVTSGDCFTENLERVIIQTSGMRRNYELYKDTMFMDATYATNPYRMPLVVFSGVNNEGKNCVLGYAIVKRETMETYAWLL